MAGTYDFVVLILKHVLVFLKGSLAAGALGSRGREVLEAVHTNGQAACVGCRAMLGSMLRDQSSWAVPRVFTGPPSWAATPHVLCCVL